MRTTFLWLNSIVVLALAAGLIAQAPEPIFGTWKLNVTKSKYTPGPAPKNSTKRYEPYKGGVKATQDTTTAKGEAQHIEITGQWDGKDNPATGNPEVDTYSFRKTADRTYEIVQKKAGQVLYTVTTVVAADGKTRTVEQRGKNAKGEAVSNSMFWERQ
jgi:uncharacterized protein YcnI